MVGVAAAPQAARAMAAKRKTAAMMNFLVFILPPWLNFELRRYSHDEEEKIKFPTIYVGARHASPLQITSIPPPSSPSRPARDGRLSSPFRLWRHGQSIRP